MTTSARLWIVACLVLARPVAAADRIGHLAFRGYGSDDGIALDLTVGLQDHEGFIWAASPSGLFRYDGIRFQRFGVSEGLPSTFVTDMAIGPDGTLWGATTRGVFYKHHDRFVAVGVDVLPVDGMHLLAFDADRRTWITTTRGPYALVAPGRFELVRGWPGGEAFGILAEPDGSMLVGRGARLVRWRHDGAIEDVGHDFVEKITSIVRDGGGRLWLRAGDHLWMQPRTGAPFEDRSRAYLGSPASNAQLALGATKTLLIPTTLGLIEVDGDDAHFVKTDLGEDALNIRAVWVDREGSMWLASLGLQHELGRGLWRTISSKEGLPSNSVWSVTGLHDGSTAVATDRGVAIIDHGSIQRITDQPAVATVEQPAGILWIVTSHQIVRYDTATHATLPIDPKSGLEDGFTTAVAVDGVLWIGTESGVYRGDGAHFELVRPPGSKPSTVWGLARDGDRLWMTTGYGLFVLDRGTWFHFTTRDGLRDDGLTFVTPNRQEICASYLSSFGVTCFHYADGHITQLRHLDSSAGLSSPVPYSLTADHEGRLWVGGAKGVSIFFEDGSVDHFTRAGGAPGDDCNSNASWVEPNGDVWIGTSSGLGVFDSARYARAVAPPHVSLERGELGGGDVDFESSARGPVPYDHAQLDVEFAALSFLDERQIQYQVRLVGFDDTWRDSRGDAHYHKLASGSYQFAARARYRDARWGEPTAFDFVVATPYWQTWWFRALGIGLVGLAIVVIVRWRSRALIRRNAELEAIVQLRTLELVTANARVAHIDKLSALGRLLAQLSHEINNPLNVIHNNVGPLEDYSQALRTALDECKQLATDTDQRAAIAALWERLDLAYVVEDSAQAFAITKHAIKRIADIHNELKLFLRDEPLERELIEISTSICETATMLAHALPDVELRCELPPLPLVLVNVGRINQAVTNLLQNAADAMDGKGQITIRGSADDARVRIRISDSGAGIPAALRSKIFEPFFTTKEVGLGMGLGLSICREIMVAHHGSLEIDDSYVGGACFVITLPRAP